MMKTTLARSLGLFLLAPALLMGAPASSLNLSRADYEDRVAAIWNGQIIATLLGFPFEHRASAVRSIVGEPIMYRGERLTVAPVDDDWYYEMVAIRAFEKHGIGLTADQLGEFWVEYACGSYGSSQIALGHMQQGIKGSMAGHPRHNKFWYSIGPQFSGDVWGALAPGLPNVAARMAREYGHINGYAEGTDGGVFIATMISLGFVENDVQEIVRQALNVLHPESPFRKCVEMVIARAEAGDTFEEVVEAVESTWHMEYPATNNAVANGGIVVAGLWFGGGDFWRTMDLIAGAADFTDADCNAANAISVVCAIHGMKGLPPELVAQLGDRVVGASMGKVTFPHPVDESISELARRTAAIGEKIVLAEGAKRKGKDLVIPVQRVATQPLERFRLEDYMQYWNPDWTLVRAGFGGGDAGWLRTHVMTWLEGDILHTYPANPVIRGCYLTRTMRLGDQPKLKVDVGAEAGRSWRLIVYADNQLIEERVISGAENDRAWQSLEYDLSKYAGRETVLRLYQRVEYREPASGNALWRNLRVE